MKRTIKFRGKHKDTEKWIYGDLVTRVGCNNIYHYTIHSINLYSEEDNLIIKNTIGQFTSFYDDDYYEIYEDDIIEYTYEENEDIFTEKGIIVFNHGAFEVHYKNSWLGLLQEIVNKSKHIKIIGNKYDNPELLK